MSIYSALINTSPYEFETGYNYYLIDCSGGNITLSLPENIYDNIFFTIKRMDSTTNTCEININSTDLSPIDDSTSIISLSIYNYIQLISYNGKWWILNRN
jgi:hypothetical protein